jgi:hypothetical protein
MVNSDSELKDLPNESTYYILLDAKNIPCEKIGVHPYASLPLTTPNSGKSSAHSADSTAPRGNGMRTRPLMLALDRHIFDFPLEERLQSRTSDHVAWTTTMFPVIYHSIREARAEPRTSIHHNSRTSFSDTTAAKPTTTATPRQHRLVPQSVPTLAYSTRHPTATSARTNTASYDCTRYPPVLSWAQQCRLRRAHLA